ncbi:MAG TPA: hypothetical protein VJQ77_07205 [Novosphingobium sp.]|nr:hypothetical protein [Novosphingobium sp.]
MSDRLAISASFSVLMMAIYVLFGENVQRAPFGPSQFIAASEQGIRVKTPELPRSPGEFLKLVD